MNAKKAKIFLMADPLMQLKKKTGRTCEKVEVYEYLLHLVAKDEGAVPMPSDKSKHMKSRCGNILEGYEEYCDACGSRILWEEATE